MNDLLQPQIRQSCQVFSGLARRFDLLWLAATTSRGSPAATTSRGSPAPVDVSQWESGVAARFCGSPLRRLAARPCSGTELARCYAGSHLAPLQAPDLTAISVASRQSYMSSQG